MSEPIQRSITVHGRIADGEIRCGRSGQREEASGIVVQEDGGAGALPPDGRCAAGGRLHEAAWAFESVGDTNHSPTDRCRGSDVAPDVLRRAPLAVAGDATVCGPGCAGELDSSCCAGSSLAGGTHSDISASREKSQLTRVGRTARGGAGY